VVALQKAEAIFNMSASFCLQEAGLEHQSLCPEVPGPETLTSDLTLARLVKDKIPEIMREQFTRDQPFDMRTINRVDPFDPQPVDATKSCWIRTTDALPDDPHIHHELLAYISDYGFIGTSLNPHGTTIFDRKLQVASLDHAIWFHRPFRADEWLLYQIDSPNASAAKGFCRGQIFKRDGTLVASVAQEGLIRRIAPR
jgi:acyl-CoA thioesterase-2